MIPERGVVAIAFGKMISTWSIVLNQEGEWKGGKQSLASSRSAEEHHGSISSRTARAE